jgi:hypothetical protein
MVLKSLQNEAVELEFETSESERREDRATTLEEGCHAPLN